MYPDELEKRDKKRNDGSGKSEKEFLKKQYKAKTC